MRPRQLFAAIAVTLGVAAGLVLAEFAVRLLLPRGIWDFIYVNDDIQVDPRLGWSHKPNLRIEAWDEAGARIDFKTNGDGLQPAGAARRKRPGTIRILMVGDSTTVGRSVPDEGRVHRQLERALRERGIAAEALNAGVGGYATDQALLRLETLGALYAPDIVVYTVCDDDIGQNSLARDSGVYKPMFEIRASGELGLLPPRPQAQLEGAEASLEAWVQYSALYRAIQPVVYRIRAALGHWSGRDLGIGDEIYYSRAALEKPDWRLFDALLARMDAVSRASGGRLYLALHPSLGEVWEPYIAETIRRTGIAPGAYDRHALERKVSAVASKRGIAFIPQIDEFRKRAAEGPFHLLPRDPHCNETCYRITASLLAERIAADIAR